MIKNAIIAVLFTGCLFLYFCKSPKVEEAEKVIAKNEAVAEQVKSQVAIIAKKFDDDGLMHATIKAKNEIKPEQAAYVGVLDTAAMKLNIQAKKIIELTAVVTKLKAENLKASRTVVLGRPEYGYEDKFAKIRFRPDTVFDTLGVTGGQFDLNYNSELNLVQYKKRNWFLGANKSYIDIWANDPRNTVNGVKRLTVKQESPDYGLRFQAFSDYTLETGVFRTGPAIRIDIGRFSIKAARTYNPIKLGPPQHVVAGTYDILQF